MGMAGAKIIIIEHDTDFQELLVYELEDAGHHTLEVGDGVEGLATVEAESSDVIISHIEMPHMDVYQLRQRFLNRPCFSNTLFLFLSALAFQQAIDKGTNIGADDYLTFGSVPSRIETLIV